MFARAGSGALAMLAGMAVGVIVVSFVWMIVLIDQTDGRRALAPSGGAAPAAAAPRPVRITPSARVRSLPAGLFCRDLRAKGYSYVEAVEYWRHHGRPDRMDADRNGVPCETVYTRAAVAAFWYG